MRSYVPARGLDETAVQARAPAPESRPCAALERRGRVGRLVLGGPGGGEPRPGALQPLQADRGEPLAAFPELEGFLQGEAPAFQPADYLEELVARLLVRHLLGGRPLRRLAAGGPAGRLITGRLLAGGLAARRAAPALRLTRLGGHGANLAG